MAERIARLRVFTDGLLPRGRDRPGLGAECGPTAPYRDAINGIVAPTLFDDSYAMAADLPLSEERTGFAGPVTVAREPYGVQGAARPGCFPSRARCAWRSPGWLQALGHRARDGP